MIITGRRDYAGLMKINAEAQRRMETNGKYYLIRCIEITAKEAERMAGEQNIEAYKLNTERARELGKKGGAASARATKRRKQMRETLEEVLTLALRDGTCTSIDKIASLAAAKGKNITVQEAMLLAMVKKALKGDVKAAEWVRDTIGEKPSTQTEFSIEDLEPLAELLK